MNDIVLSSGILTVTKILKKTTAVFFNDLRVGDVIEISFKLERQERGRELYAARLKVVNIFADTEYRNSVTRVCNYLSNFEVE